MYVRINVQQNITKKGHERAIPGSIFCRRYALFTRDSFGAVDGIHYGAL